MKNKKFFFLIVSVLLLGATTLIALDKMYLYDAKGRRIHMFQVGVELGKIVGSCNKKDVKGTITALENCKKLLDTLRGTLRATQNKEIYAAVRGLHAPLDSRIKYMNKEKSNEKNVKKRMEKIQKEMPDKWKKAYTLLLKKRVVKKKGKMQMVFHLLIPNEFTLGFIVGQGLTDPSLVRPNVYKKQLDTMIDFASKDTGDALSVKSVTAMKALKNSLGNADEVTAKSQGVVDTYQ